MADRHAQMCDHPGVRVAYDVVGHGPPVALIHDWACRRSDWDGVAGDLSRDHRLLILDLPWHGASRATRDDWSMADLGALVAAVLVDEGMQGATLVGHSMGAAVAMEAARLGTGYQVVALDGLTFMHMYPRQSVSDTDAFLAPYEVDFPAAVHGLCERAAGPDADPLFIEVVAREMGTMDATTGVAMLRHLFDWDMDAALDHADAAGTRITAFAAKSMLSPRVTDAYGNRMRIIPVALGGHFFPRQHPAATADLIRGVIAASVGDASGSRSRPRGKAWDGPAAGDDVGADAPSGD